MFRFALVFLLFSSVFSRKLNYDILKQLLAEEIVEDELGKIFNGDTNGGFCSGRKDGNYEDPKKCDGFIQCSNGITYKTLCPGGLAYNKDTDQCSGPVCTGGPSFCKDKVDGDYKFPPDCRSFVTCSNGIAYRKPCNRNNEGVLEWFDKEKRCDYPETARCMPNTEAKYCTMMGKVYAVAEKWTVGCELSCICQENGEVDCRQICPGLSPGSRPCGQHSVKSWTNVPSDIKPSCLCRTVKECNLD